ncbi:hypothetical protein OB920_05685 [Halobacteria archaeon HArc-gm2]|nr:hypothetical protein [Halobacteria archaeon HArc-gm2]
MSTNTDNHIGWFGWFSLLGFIVLGLLAIGESMAALEWPLTVGLTAALAILAGIGAIALWMGNDPTARDRAAEAQRR